MKIKKLPYEEFHYIYSKVPRLCVDLIVKTKEGILLTKRGIEPKKGWWHFPGGTVLINETLKNTAQRVAMEELKTGIKIIKSLGFLEYTEWGDFGQAVSITFLVKTLGEPKKGRQTQQIGYFTNLPNRTLPDVKRYLESEFRL